MNNGQPAQYDVIIIGGGPGGSTTGAMLRTYDKNLRILILEKEVFPREHVGESQLPPISAVLNEMGCWDKVERANFPIKVGVNYTWGKTTDPWDFEFIPVSQWRENEPRPGKYEGWRRQVAFQVDRAVYDEILLDHAASLGCEVREGVRVKAVRKDGDRVAGVELETGEVVTARYYVDASGNAAILRRAMGCKVDVPTLLKNVAFWDYWTNPRWAEQFDLGAARVRIRSVPYGWLWFIPIAPDRTSIGLVCPAEHYKQAGKRPDQMLMDAVNSEAYISRLIEGGTRTGAAKSTTDWSYVVDRTFGENWFLVGECSGFADPILAAGLTLTQTGARELAYTILELDRGELEREWLVHRYDEAQRRRVKQHMRFAEYWYTANGFFDAIQENCVKIAADAGLNLDPAHAFRWLSTGGLGDDAPGQVGVGGLDVAGVKQIMRRFSGKAADWRINGKNVFKLNLANATETAIGRLVNGRIHRAPCYERGPARLALVGVQGMLVEALRESSDIDQILTFLRTRLALEGVPPEHVPVGVHHAVQSLEVMANDFWVTCAVKKGKPLLNVDSPLEGQIIRTHDPEGKTAHPLARG